MKLTNKNDRLNAAGIAVFITALLTPGALLAALGMFLGRRERAKITKDAEAREAQRPKP